MGQQQLQHGWKAKHIMAGQVFCGFGFICLPVMPFSKLHPQREPGSVEIFFSAHGVPKSYVEEAGDPYKEEMEVSLTDTHVLIQT